MEGRDWKRPRDNEDGLKWKRERVGGGMMGHKDSDCNWPRCSRAYGASRRRGCVLPSLNLGERSGMGRGGRTNEEDRRGGRDVMDAF